MALAYIGCPDLCLSRFGLVPYGAFQKDSVDSVMGENGSAVRTHDPHRDDFNSNHFSGTDKQGIAHDARGKPEYRGYLGTPSGRFLIYNPRTGQEGPLQ